MSLSAVFRFENLDSTRDLNSVHEYLFDKGVYFGGEVTATTNTNSISITPFRVMSYDGMAVISDETTTISIANGTYFVVIYAKYVVDDDPIIEIKTVSTTTYEGLGEEITNYYVKLAQVTVSGGVATVDKTKRDEITPVGRNSYKGYFLSTDEEPSTTNTILIKGDWWFYEENGTISMKQYNGTTIVEYVSGSSVSESVDEHRGNYNTDATVRFITNPTTITSKATAFTYGTKKGSFNVDTNEKVALHGSYLSAFPTAKPTDWDNASYDFPEFLGSSATDSMPWHNNPFVTNNDPRLPLLRESKALIGNGDIGNFVIEDDKIPSTANPYILHKTPIANSFSLSITAIAGSSYIAIDNTMFSGYIYVGRTTSPEDYFSLYDSNGAALLDDSNRPYIVTGIYLDSAGTNKLDSSTSSTQITEDGFWKSANTLYVFISSSDTLLAQTFRAENVKLKLNYSSYLGKINTNAIVESNAKKNYLSAYLIRFDLLQSNNSSDTTETAIRISKTNGIVVKSNSNATVGFYSSSLAKEGLTLYYLQQTSIYYNASFLPTGLTITKQQSPKVFTTTINENKVQVDRKLLGNTLVSSTMTTSGLVVIETDSNSSYTMTSSIGAGSTSYVYAKGSGVTSGTNSSFTINTNASSQNTILTAKTYTSSSVYTGYTITQNVSSGYIDIKYEKSSVETYEYLGEVTLDRYGLNIYKDGVFNNAYLKYVNGSDSRYFPQLGLMYDVEKYSDFGGTNVYIRSFGANTSAEVLSILNADYCNASQTVVGNFQISLKPYLDDYESYAGVNSYLYSSGKLFLGSSGKYVSINGSIVTFSTGDAQIGTTTITPTTITTSSFTTSSLYVTTLYAGDSTNNSTYGTPNIVCYDSMVLAHGTALAGNYGGIVISLQPSIHTSSSVGNLSALGIFYTTNGTFVSENEANVVGKYVVSLAPYDGNTAANGTIAIIYGSKVYKTFADGNVLNFNSEGLFIDSSESSKIYSIGSLMTSTYFQTKSSDSNTRSVSTGLLASNSLYIQKYTSASNTNKALIQYNSIALLSNPISDTSDVTVYAQLARDYDNSLTILQLNNKNATISSSAPGCLIALNNTTTYDACDITPFGIAFARGTGTDANKSIISMYNLSTTISTNYTCENYLALQAESIATGANVYGIYGSTVLKSCREVGSSESLSKQQHIVLQDAIVTNTTTNTCYMEVSGASSLDNYYTITTYRNALAQAPGIGVNFISNAGGTIGFVKLIGGNIDASGSITATTGSISANTTISANGNINSVNGQVIGKLATNLIVTTDNVTSYDLTTTYPAGSYEEGTLLVYFNAYTSSCTVTYQTEGASISIDAIRYVLFIRINGAWQRVDDSI